MKFIYSTFSIYIRSFFIETGIGASVGSSVTYTNYVNEKKTELLYIFQSVSDLRLVEKTI